MEDISRVHLAQGPLTLIFTFTLGAALRLSKMFYVRPGRKFVLLHFLLPWPQVSSKGPPWTPVPPLKKRLSTCERGGHLPGESIVLSGRFNIDQRKAERSALTGCSGSMPPLLLIALWGNTETHRRFSGETKEDLTAKNTKCRSLPLMGSEDRAPEAAGTCSNGCRLVKTFSWFLSVFSTPCSQESVLRLTGAVTCSRLQGA